MIYEPAAEQGHVFAALDRLRILGQHEMAGRTTALTRPLRGSHGRLLSLIPDEGVRPSEIATDAWITKQAAGIRLREMEQLGWVTIDADPGDGRALVVKRTAEGTRIRRAALRMIAEMEREWADRVGSERYATFRQVMDELTADAPT